MTRLCRICEYEELYDRDATVCEECNYELRNMPKAERLMYLTEEESNAVEELNEDLEE